MRLAVRIMCIYCAFGISPNFGIWGWVIGTTFFLWLFWNLGQTETEDMQEDRLEREDSRTWEKVETARRGSEVDPTRPDEHPLLLTRQVRRTL